MNEHKMQSTFISYSLPLSVFSTKNNWNHDIVCWLYFERILYMRLDLVQNGTKWSPNGANILIFFAVSWEMVICNYCGFNVIHLTATNLRNHLPIVGSCQLHWAVKDEGRMRMRRTATKSEYKQHIDKGTNDF